MINIDQKHRFKEIDAQLAFDALMLNIIIAAVVFIAMTIMFISIDAMASPAPKSITGATYDNLMSVERAEYMVLFEHGEVLTEEDME